MTQQTILESVYPLFLPAFCELQLQNFELVKSIGALICEEVIALWTIWVLNSLIIFNYMEKAVLLCIWNKKISSWWSLHPIGIPYHCLAHCYVDRRLFTSLLSSTFNGIASETEAHDAWKHEITAENNRHQRVVHQPLQEFKHGEHYVTEPLTSVPHLTSPKCIVNASNTSFRVILITWVSSAKAFWRNIR